MHYNRDKGVMIMQNTNRMANVIVRMDADLKKRAEEVYSEMGLNMSTAITIFTKAVIREGRIPFEIKVDPFWSEANQAVLRERAADMDAGRNVHEHELSEIADE